MHAYILSHNGLGDNLFMNGALRFISKFYDKIFFLCKHKYINCVIDFYSDNKKIECIPLYNEDSNIKDILNKNIYNNKNNDIFICGLHKRFLPSKITNSNYLNYKINSEKYIIDYDTIDSNNYYFIKDFYTDLGLNLNFFFDYFYLQTTQEAINLYNSIKEYYIIFLQLKSSCNKHLNIENIIKQYLNDDKVILICNDINLYSENINEIKFKLAEKFVLNKIIDYTEIIKNSDEIYIIDSCFTGIVLPYLKTNQLKTKKVRIIRREDIKKYIL